ncbi:MAG TPA: sodium:proton antiporter [Bacteroidales bacterium]|nr:sodium:proton antiporter [Bacteroidales bacterium]
MIKKWIILGILAGMGLIFFDLFSAFRGNETLGKTADYYARHGAEEVGASNIVTAIVVTYRGFDTLGEVTILFLTAAIISFVLKIRQEDILPNRPIRITSELLDSASQVIVPVIFMVGIYIFVNGHLTPGGGFPGGAVIASGVLLMILSNPNFSVSHKVIAWVESISGVGFVLLGVMGILFAGGFLDNRVLGLGDFGKLFSAGIIPFIYSFIGLKVGAELSNILGAISHAQNEKN